MANLREKILTAQDIKKELVTVEEWGVQVEVRGLKGSERARLMQDSVDAKTGSVDFVKLYPDLVIASTYDPETGEKVFEPTDRDALNEKSGAALEKIAQVAMRLSGLTQADLDGARKN